MGFVDGWSPMGLTDELAGAVRHRPRGPRAGLAYQLVEGIALLSKVDWQAKGLDDLGRPDGFHERQVDRWTAFLERIKGRELPGFDEAAAWLRAHRPIDYVPGLMHGDYQFANVMYRARRAGAARRDRRLGDGHGRRPEARPRLGGAELARGHERARRRRESSYVDMTGMPSRDEVLAHYAEVSGRQVDDIDYYVVLAKWKLAVVLEQGFQRAGDDEKLQAFGPIVLDLMQGAADLAETTDYRRMTATRRRARRASGAARSSSLRLEPAGRAQRAHPELIARHRRGRRRRRGRSRRSAPSCSPAPATGRSARAWTCGRSRPATPSASATTAPRAAFFRLARRRGRHPGRRRRQRHRGRRRLRAAARLRRDRRVVRGTVRAARGEAGPLPGRRRHVPRHAASR